VVIARRSSSIAVNYTIAGVKLTPKLYYDVNLDGPTAEFSAAFTLPLKDLARSSISAAPMANTCRRTSCTNRSPPRKRGVPTGRSRHRSLSAYENSKVVVGFAYAKGEDSFVKQGSAPKVANPLAMGRGVVSLSYAWTY